MEENAIWLVYLYGLYTDLGLFVEAYLLISLILLTFAWLPFMVLADKPKNVMLIKITKFIINYYKIAVIALLLNIFMPSRNILVMMLSAEPLMQTVKSGGDNNTTESFITILDNSVQYLEKHSRELVEDK